MLDISARGAIQQIEKMEHSKFPRSVKKWIFSANRADFWQSNACHIGKDITIVQLMTSAPARVGEGARLNKEVRMT